MGSRTLKNVGKSSSGIVLVCRPMPYSMPEVLSDNPLHAFLQIRGLTSKIDTSNNQDKDLKAVLEK
jgi:hypothetical protein